MTSAPAHLPINWSGATPRMTHLVATSLQGTASRPSSHQLWRIRLPTRAPARAQARQGQQELSTHMLCAPGPARREPSGSGALCARCLAEWRVRGRAFV